MDSRSSQSKNITSNTGPKEVADIIVVLGPRHESTYETISKCLAELGEDGLKYVILGNGKDAITDAELNNLPKAIHILINGHGEIRENNGELCHQMQTRSLDKQHYDTSLDLIKLLQVQTDARRFVTLSCYSGRLNREIQQSKSLKLITQVITTADEAHPCYSWGQIEDLARWVCKNKASDMPKKFTDFFGSLIASYPETISYGLQTSETYEYCTIRSGLRGLLNDFSIPEWINTNIQFYNLFLLDKGVQPTGTPLIDIKDYQYKSFFYHVAHLDGSIVEKLIHDNPDILQDTRYSPIEIAILNLGYYAGKWTPEKINEAQLLLKTLFQHIPDGIKQAQNYFQEKAVEWDESRLEMASKILYHVIDGKHLVLPENPNIRAQATSLDEQDNLTLATILIKHAETLLQKEECQTVDHFLERAKSMLNLDNDEEPTSDTNKLIHRISLLEKLNSQVSEKNNKVCAAMQEYLINLREELQEKDFTTTLMKLYSNPEPEIIQSLRSQIKKLDLLENSKNLHLTKSMFNSIVKLLKQGLSNQPDQNVRDFLQQQLKLATLTKNIIDRVLETADRRQRFRRRKGVIKAHRQEDKHTPSNMHYTRRK